MRDDPDAWYDEMRDREREELEAAGGIPELPGDAICGIFKGNDHHHPAIERIECGVCGAAIGDQCSGDGIRWPHQQVHVARSRAANTFPKV